MKFVNSKGREVERTDWTPKEEALLGALIIALSPLDEHRQMFLKEALDSVIEQIVLASQDDRVNATLVDWNDGFNV